MDIIHNHVDYGTSRGFRQALEGTPHNTQHNMLGGHMRSLESQAPVTGNIICQAGTYQDQTLRTSCKLCKNNQYSIAGRSSCEYEASSCPKGTHASETAACTSCVAGKYTNQTQRGICTQRG